jgi:hypothetical protein
MQGLWSMYLPPLPGVRRIRLPQFHSALGVGSWIP